MKIIDAKNAVLGRLASYVAKETLKGEEICIVNCEEIFISGNKEEILEKFLIKRKMGGSSQKGPKIHKDSEKFVKRTIRGMLPDPRQGRGKQALKKIKCYKAIPEEFKDKEIIKLEFKKPDKYIKLKELLR